MKLITANSRVKQRRRPLRLSCVTGVSKPVQARRLSIRPPDLCFRVAAPWVALAPGALTHQHNHWPGINIRPVVQVLHHHHDQRQWLLDQSVQTNVSRAVFAAASNRLTHSISSISQRYLSKRINSALHLHRVHRSVSALTNVLHQHSHRQQVLNTYATDTGSLTSIRNAVTLFKVLQLYSHGQRTSNTYLTNVRTRIAGTTAIQPGTTSRIAVQQVLQVQSRPHRLTTIVNRVVRETLSHQRTLASSVLMSAPPPSAERNISTSLSPLQQWGRTTPTRRRQLLYGIPAVPSTAISTNEHNIHLTRCVLPLELRYRETRSSTPVAPPAPVPPTAAAPEIDIERLSQTVIRKINKTLRIERERRGLL